MLRATLTRGPSTDEGTFGTLALAGGPELRTVELPWRNNATGNSCIPKGTYRCAMAMSPSKGWVYAVQNVPGRSHILIHIANFAGDTTKGWVSQLEGCIAPAIAVGTLPNPAGHAQRAGLQSGKALDELLAWSGGQPFDLEIR